jgi:MSHA biogenesis protein MshJ
MHARLSALGTHIDALSLRERGILLLVGLLVLYLFADQLFVAPSLQGIAQRNVEIAELQAKLSALQIRADSLNHSGQDPLAQRSARIAELEARVAAQDAQFDEQLGRLVRPQQAAPLLREILQQQPSLRLLSLGTAPGAPLLSSERTARIVRYDVELQVEGDYLAALDYLRRLEQLPWTLFWDALELHAQEHPRNRVQLTLYTLGQRP